MPSSVLKVCCEIRHADPHHLQPPSKPLFSPRALFCHSECPPQSGTGGGGGVNPLTFLQPSQFCFWFIRKQRRDICHRFDFSYVSFVQLCRIRMVRRGAGRVADFSSNLTSVVQLPMQKINSTTTGGNSSYIYHSSVQLCRIKILQGEAG